MSNHTEGPWVALPEECDKPYIRIRGTVLGGRYKIANVLTPVYEGVHEREAKETRANARLIEAAPELLTTLKELDALGGLGPIAYKMIANAIAKAEGTK
jgi:hypothetical protein